MDVMQDQESASPSVSVAVAITGGKEESTQSNTENAVAMEVEEKGKDVPVKIPKEAA